MEFLAAIFTGLVTAFLGWQSLRHWRLARLVQTTPTVPIAQVKPGPVAIHGRIHAHTDLLRSPPTGIPCVYYRYLVQERTQDGNWSTVKTEERFAAAHVSDDTGRALIDLHPAALDLDAPAHRRQGKVRATRRWFVNLLEEGQEVHVLGEARVQDGEVRIVPHGEVLLVSWRREDRLVDEHRFHAALYGSGVLLSWCALWVAVA